MLMVPQGGTGNNCTSTGCVVDLNSSCPAELKMTSLDGDGMACKSACKAFGQPEYCCSGAYATPDTCKPSSYSGIFKNACPRAYSYAYEDKTAPSHVPLQIMLSFSAHPLTPARSHRKVRTLRPVRRKRQTHRDR